MGIALLIAGLVVAFLLLDALLLVFVFRRAARRKGGLVFSFGLSIGPDEQASNVRRIPQQQGTPVERPDESIELPSGEQIAAAGNRVIDLTGDENDLRWPEASVWTDSTSLDDAAQSRPSASSKAE